jgi:hypothetical protein
MKTVLVVAMLIGASATSAFAQYINQNQNTYGGSGYGTGSNPNSHYVSPYTNSHGTTVQGHNQTNPNSTQYDNYGTRGNVNPYTGATGTRSPRY